MLPRGRRILAEVVEEALGDSPFPAAAVLLALGAGVPGVARALGVSPRTARRRMAEAGGCRTLLRSIRREAAARMLGAGLPTSVVSEYLGFTAAASFRRFLRHEFGPRVRALRSPR